jgi:hypothetical protein
MAVSVGFPSSVASETHILAYVWLLGRNILILPIIRMHL